MPLDVLQRYAWTGQPVHLGSMFTVTKGTRSADCELWTHQLGWELRADDRPGAAAVCAAQDDVLDVGEAWRAALIGKGWA